MGQSTPALSREILSAEPNLLQEKDHKIKAVVTVLNVPAKDKQKNIRYQNICVSFTSGLISKAGIFS